MFRAQLKIFIQIQLHLAKSLWRTFSSANVVGLLLINMSVMGAATITYWMIEGWTLLDAAYFSVVTAATIGYGDVVPVTALGKIFTMGYVVVGVGLFVVLATAIATEFYNSARQHPKLEQRLRDPRHHKDPP